MDSKTLLSTQGSQIASLRSGYMAYLYPVGVKTPDTNNQIAQLLGQLTGSFSNYAGNQQTAFDNGAGRSNASSVGGLLERQVERAFTQVLGRSPGRGADSFMNALNSAFPADTTGQVAYTPSRSIVSVYGVDNAGNSSTLSGQLSTEQANLYREASIIANDALKIVAGLMPVSPQADIDEVEALRALIGSEVKGLVDEFARVDLPRSQRVVSYLDSLDRDLAELGRRSGLDQSRNIVNVSDESQFANFRLLQNYAQTLRNSWDTFNSEQGSATDVSFSTRLDRANVLLPVIAESTSNLVAALDSVDFSENERRSSAARLNTLQGVYTTTVTTQVPPGVVNTLLSDITISDLIDWLDRYATLEGPSILADSGVFGLSFVTTQANELFRVIAPVIGVLKTANTVSISKPLLAQVLTNERVSWALDNLLSQLNELAKLAETGGITILDTP